ncbi:MAG: RNA-guided pseudouridylation complex pseudouridine synthase subunit Cbf5 [Candidatus Micrarchaeota archaeon]|nr:RNA-guided pseudouridylation complex pseudouridine synthase subunit Cbf5 [Candidatus Micrarchaeota archaeon]
MLEDKINNSFIFVDKPPNMLSHEMTSWVGRIIGSSKAGHIGTLDPKVTGVMIIGLGKATKLIQFFSGIRKEYVAVIDWKKEVPEDFAIERFSRFKGKIKQIPPEQSAVARRERERNVYSLELLEHDGRFSVFRTLVDPGTYIRTLCADMGGKMADLRRISAGPITEKDCHIMQRIVDASNLYKKGYPKQLDNMLVSVDDMIEKFGIRKIWIKKNAAIGVSNGSQLDYSGIEKGDFSKGEYVALYYGKMLIGMGEAISNEKRGFVIKPVRITANRKEIEESN